MNNYKIYITLLVLLILTLSCKNRPDYQPSQEGGTNINQQLEDANRILIKKDRQKIAGFVKRRDWKMIESETGLWYEVLNPGSRDSIKSGMKITLEYSLSLLDGTECYNSHKDGAKSFIVGRGNVESGLEQGVLLLSNGASARFIMPPHLAHGLTGDGKKIPGRAVIIYEIESISSIN